MSGLVRALAHEFVAHIMQQNAIQAVLSYLYSWWALVFLADRDARAPIVRISQKIHDLAQAMTKRAHFILLPLID
ncbi:hypothetical protein AKO53_00170 [Brucella abortus]|uniref:Uncharacterized protein n=1 Tax=Brucella suis TaxID=29461 RepID=A0AAI8EAN3_BRUSS|nr:hypothetical protein DM30_07895 [Brucella abortus]AJM85345.1 hypothetical protein TI82_07410 [Brucella suis]AOG44195.1 hypothetical protein BFS01_07700 [Brucella sp. 2002734562]ERM04741.1 hypothetical protein P408_10745 [Brucella abortus S99]KDV05586.1 hypothetical protein BF16_16185 [Brucella suis 1330]KEX96505.1 hypothetical protein IL60_0214865 [Brucella inopinata BO1]KEX97030.1 hypothetical protein X658_0212105 [Brucella neotomae 5K33]KEX98600.1 hypothetical protein IL61_0210090 [Bruc